MPGGGGDDISSNAMRPALERALEKVAQQREVLDVESERAHAGDAEAVHRMRVAARKLRTWLSLLGRGKRVKKARRALQALKDGLGPLRDLQVSGQGSALEQEGALALARLALEGFSRRAKKFRRVLEDPHPRRPRGTRKQLRRLSRIAQRALERLKPGLDAARAHRARILLRKIRHGLQLVERGEPVAASLELLQNRLGALHDLDLQLEKAPTEKLRRARRASAEEAWVAIEAWKSERRGAELIAALS